MARNTRSCLGSPAPAKPSRWPKSSKSWAVPHSLGFRLPSALDNRPLTFEQIEHRVNRVVYVSATPGPYKLTQTGGAAGEQIIGPTGLVDDLPLASGVNPALAGLETDSLPEVVPPTLWLARGTMSSCQAAFSGFGKRTHNLDPRNLLAGVQILSQ